MILDHTVVVAWLQELVEQVLLVSFQPHCLTSTLSLLLLPHAGPSSSSSKTTFEEPHLLHCLSFYLALGASYFLF